MNTLAICIPTYKRPKMLQRCIESAFISAKGVPLKIFISDDSVSEINSEVIRDLQEKFKEIYWHRNEANLGIDLNIQKALSISDCDYNWIIGEDDLFLPEAIFQIFNKIQNKSYPFIYSNYQYVDETCTKVLGVAINSLSEGEQDVNRFISNYLWAIGFIGACLIHRKSWEDTDGEKYKDTYFTHVGRILDMLESQKMLYISALPAVSNRAQGEDTFTWKKDSFGVFFGFEKMCRVAAERNLLLKDSIVVASNNYRSQFSYLSLKTTFRLRSEGAFDLQQYKKYISHSDIELFRKVWLLFLALAPRQIIKLFARIYYAYK